MGHRRKRGVTCRWRQGAKLGDRLEGLAQNIKNVKANTKEFVKADAK